MTDLDDLAATFCRSPLTTANAGLSHVKVKSIAAAKTFRNGISFCPPGAIVNGPYLSKPSNRRGFRSAAQGSVCYSLTLIAKCVKHECSQR